MEWEKDKRRTDPLVKIAGRLVAATLNIPIPANMEMDRTRGTDLILMKFAGTSVAIRIRDARYYWDEINYKDQVTIRAHRPSGFKTELLKLINDEYAQFNFYGFGDTDGGVHTKFLRWVLFMPEGIRYCIDEKSYIKKSNIDNSSDFYSFHLIDLLPWIIADYDRQFNSDPSYLVINNKGPRSICFNVPLLIPDIDENRIDKFKELIRTDRDFLKDKKSFNDLLIWATYVRYRPMINKD